MTIVIPLNEPAEIVAGDQAQWTRSIDGYSPDDGWVLSYVFLNSTYKFTAEAEVDDANNYVVTLSSATTADVPSGEYQWQAYVEKDGVRHTNRTGLLKVNPNFEAQTTLDIRSDAKKALDAIEEEIMGRITGGMTQEYTIGNRSLKKAPIADLIVLRDKYRAIYKSEQNAERVKNGLAATNRVLVRL